MTLKKYLDGWNGNISLSSNKEKRRFVGLKSRKHVGVCGLPWRFCSACVFACYVRR